MLDVLIGKTLKPIGQLLDHHFLSQLNFSTSLSPGQRQHYLNSWKSQSHIEKVGGAPPSGCRLVLLDCGS